jgi:sulfatase modifying factor 1
MSEKVFLLFLVSALWCSCSDINDSEFNTPVLDLQFIKADQYEVSIGEFGRFLKETGYISTADSLEWSGFFDPYQKKWVVAKNANWEKPDGRKKISNQFPVTQVSYYDACAYCEWKGGRLPSAQEWDRLAGDTVILGNIWQGLFPYQDEGADGYEISIAPRGQYAPNEMQLFDMFGNVWEWTTTWDSLKNARIIKGGSFLCDYNVCAGYVPSKYQTTPDDSGLNHLGFRCVYDPR